jgi:hypothetical protein
VRRDMGRFRGVATLVLASVMVGVAWTPLSAAAAVGRTVTPPANAAADPEAALTSVACMSSSCFAIGSYMDAAGHGQSMVTVNGRRATRIAPPADAAVDDTSASIDSIGCSSHRCIAVGEYESEPGGPQQAASIQPVISVNGHRATKVTLPPDATASGEGALTSIACNARSCLAVGWYTGASGFEAMASVNGRAARTVTPPADVGEPSETGFFTSVACSAKSCIAIGSYVDTSGVRQPVVSVNGGATTKVKLPAGAVGGTLTAVGCSSRECVAAGTYYNASAPDGSYDAGAMISVDGGPASNIAAPPVPAGSGTPLLSSVACGAPGCIVFGSFYNPVFDGGNMSSEPRYQGMADVPGHPATQVAVANNLSPHAVNQLVTLGGAACNKHTCVAAGSTADTVYFSSNDQRPVNNLALVSVNRHAAITVTPPAGGPSVAREDQLLGVACSPRRCMAVGDYWDQTNEGEARSNNQAMLWVGR